MAPVWATVHITSYVEQSSLVNPLTDGTAHSREAFVRMKQSTSIIVTNTGRWG